MKSYLVVGLPNRDPVVLRWIRDLGFDGVRHGIRMTDTWDHIRMVFNALKEVPELSPLFLLPFEEPHQDPKEMLEFTETIAHMIEDWGYDREDVALEFCNEPNIFSEQWKRNPELLGKIFAQAIPRIRKRAKNIKILSPSVANLDKNTQKYAKRLFAPIVKQASDYHVAFHRYPYKGHAAHPGYGDRQDEWMSFLINTSDGTSNHEYWCTETGYSQWAKRPKPFPMCFTDETYERTEEKQADFAAVEYDIWNMDTHVAAVTWYQINDGPGTDHLDGYGIRRVDMTPKVIAERFPNIHEDVHR